MIDIGHPAHVHFFKNFVHEMQKRGHKVLITARDKDVAVHLLKAYAIEHTVVGKIRKGKLNLIREWLGRDWTIYLMARKYKPDILTGINNPCAAHVSRLIGAKSVIFNDTEHAKLGNAAVLPFASVICTPSCFNIDLGKKQVRYNGYHELAYLHPNYFKPNPLVLDELGLKETDKYTVVRFIAWQASHDIGQHGFNIQEKRELVAELEKYGRVLITSESPLPEEFEKYRITLSPEKIHSLLYYATLYIGEGATMASECAVLGVPAICVSTLRLGYLDEQEEKYGLVYNFQDFKQVIQKTVQLIQQKNLRQEWAQKREKLLTDKIDVTKFMVEFIEDYMQSYNRNKERNKNRP
jgi:predicted glycosyltransferase